MNKTEFKIWAILNLTPDSFFAESRVKPKVFVNQCMIHLEDGADILDVGAESSRPFSKPVSAEEEWSRLKEPLTELRNVIGEAEFSRIVSLDTHKAETARKAMDLGVSIINDISGGKDPGMFNVVSEHKGSIVLMHSKGNPGTMQIDPVYDDIVQEVLRFLQEQTDVAVQAGISSSNIIWDFGIGFGKTLEHNLTLLNNIKSFKKSGYQLMAGISRKSFIGKLLDIPEADNRRDATMIIHTILALHFVDILRVHDIKEANLIRKIIKYIQ